ncbi:MAG: MlaD family protein [Candidatus Cardinium sp.]|nr:MlaD family protein [Candidatus Cardinium sp.]
MQLNKNYKIGFLALFAFTVLYYGLLFLKGRDPFSRYNVYQVSYPVNKNLSVSAPVKFKGHEVGKIAKIEISSDLDHTTLLTIEVNKKFPLTDKSRVMLTNMGMVEGNALELEWHKEGRLLTKQDLIIGECHPSFSEVDLNMLTTRATVVMSNLTSAIDRVNVILNNVEKASHSLHTAIQHIHKSVSTISNDIMAVSMPLADPIEGIPSLLPDIRSILGAIKAFPFKEFSYKTTHVLYTMETLLQSIAKNHGTLGRLINDPTLYNNLNGSVEHLNSLLLSMKNNPSRYLHFSLLSFGRK